MPKKTIQPEKKDSVTYSQDFAAVIKSIDGRKRLIIKSQRWYDHQLQKFKENEELTLVIHNRRPKRTEQQNRYYWGAYLPIIADETGEHNLDRLHELFKGKFLTEGIVEVLGEKVRMKKSTTKLSKSEFSDYITKIAALTQVEPPPTENYWGIGKDE